MRKRKYIILFIILTCLQFSLLGQEYRFLETTDGLAGITIENGIDSPVTVKVVYDNYVKTPGLESDWGYSIVISGLAMDILFDAGTKPELFESNFIKMGLDASAIDMIVISHEHGDHTGGIPAFTKMRKDIPVLIPRSFSYEFKTGMSKYGLEPLLTDKPDRICDNLYTSGEFNYSIPEQALVLNTKDGLVVMTGCSHPGIIVMLKQIRSEFNKDIYMVLGGFHLLDASAKEIADIISEMKTLGVQKCGATHCTGNKQIKMFKEAFGENYIEMGVGQCIVIN